MTAHEFGIIDLIDINKDYGVYEPEKYNCVFLDDDILCEINERLNHIPTYYHNLRRSGFGLAYFGVTIIPPSSLLIFEEVFSIEFIRANNKEVYQLLLTVKKAIQYNKHMIHFGI